MPDIRKILEEQIETLRDASCCSDNAAECTYAMIEIVDILYPNGIPEQAETIKPLDQDKEALQKMVNVFSAHKHTHKMPSPLSMEVKLDSKEIAVKVADILKNQISSAAFRNGEFNI